MTPGAAARTAAPVAALLILAVVLLAPATLGGKVLSAGDAPLFDTPYRPASVRVGIALSLAALVAVLAGIPLGARQPPGGTSASAASAGEA